MTKPTTARFDDRTRLLAKLDAMEARRGPRVLGEWSKEFRKYAARIASKLGGLRPRYEEGKVWWYDSAVFSVPFVGRTYWVRIGSDRDGVGASFVITFDRGAIPRADYVIAEVEGWRPWPSVDELGDTLRGHIVHASGRPQGILAP